jgi:hypothetical protein
MASSWLSQWVRLTGQIQMSRKVFFAGFFFSFSNSNSLWVEFEDTYQNCHV